MMIKKTAAFIIAATCLFCFGCLIYYQGNGIQHARLWAVILIFIGFLAAYTGFQSNSEKDKKRKLDFEKKSAALKQKGTAIIVSLTDCEIKENNYYEEVPGHISAKGYFSGVPINEKPEQVEIDQSVIVYYYNQGVSKYKLVSQVFAHDAISLSVLIENKLVKLFINPADATDYIFEIASPDAQ